MEKQETEMKGKLETETGDGNWKWKLEMEIGNGNGKTHQSLVQCFLHSVLSQYSCILLSNGYRTGFMRHVLCLNNPLNTKLYSLKVLCRLVPPSSTCISTSA